VWRPTACCGAACLLLCRLCCLFVLCSAPSAPHRMVSLWNSPSCVRSLLLLCALTRRPLIVFDWCKRKNNNRSEAIRSSSFSPNIGTAVFPKSSDECLDHPSVGGSSLQLVYFHLLRTLSPIVIFLWLIHFVLFVIQCVMIQRRVRGKL
jgi:hypothetical protein